jgi:hypothetical protein
MNATRRKAIRAISDRLVEIQNELEYIMGEEEEARDNMPEILQDTERYALSEEASTTMEDADSAIQEAIDYLEDLL